MAIRTVTNAGIKKDSAQGSYKKNDPWTIGFKMLNLNKPGSTFKIRILPPNNDEKIFKDSYDGFAFAFPTHFGVGDNGKEMCVCPNRLAPRYRVKCPMCAEFSKGEQTRSSRLTFYYYINFVLLSKHENIERQDAEGKLIVYTARVPKTQVFDPIAKYMEDQDRAITDPFSLEKGCAISISVTEKVVGKDKFPQYAVMFSEASTGDITAKVRENDIKDLRLIGRYIPTNAAMRALVDGMPITEAMEVCGKIDVATGQQIGGVEEKPEVEKVAKGKAVSDDLDSDFNLDEDEDDGLFADSAAKAPKSNPKGKSDKAPVEDDDLLIDAPATDDDDLS